MKKLLILLTFVPLLIAINNLTDGYRITSGGGTQRIYSNHGGAQGSCYTIQNNHGSSDLYVPTTSAAEWLSFVTNTPNFASKTVCQPKSCKEIKDVLVNPADGYYTIDSDGAGANASYSAYCDMTLDGGGWTRVFRHHVQGGYFATVSAAITVNIGTPSADLYSVLDKIPDFATNGKYKFRHTWPGYSQRNVWLQTTNPLDDIDVAGVVPIATTAYAESNLNNFGGLELGNGTHGGINNNQSLIDGSIEAGNWFYAIGQTAAWENPPGIPADGTILPVGGVSETVLWIKDESTYVSYNSCKAILDAGASIGSGIYTIDPGNLGSPIPVYCDMTTDGGGWTRIFYHSVSGAATLFADNTEAQNSNSTLPLTTTKYSILNRMAGFQRSGQYELKINWPNSGSSIRNWWTQTSNFVSTNITGYASVSVQTVAGGWGGLEPGIIGQNLADGTVGHPDFWYAIGQTGAWNADPGTPSTPDISMSGVPRVELWVK